MDDHVLLNNYFMVLLFHYCLCHKQKLKLVKAINASQFCELVVIKYILNYSNKEIRAAITFPSKHICHSKLVEYNLLCRGQGLLNNFSKIQ